jgi:hypothetical protein
VAFGHSGRSHVHCLHRPYVQSCGFGPSAEPRGISEIFAVAVRCALPGDTRAGLTGNEAKSYDCGAAAVASHPSLHHVHCTMFTAL